MKQLSRDARLRLMKFVCSFAWSDLKVTDPERLAVRQLIDRMGFDAAEQAQIAGWLQVPPSPDELDPGEIPREHRQVFLDTARAVLESDGVTLAEHDVFAEFEELLK